MTLAGSESSEETGEDHDDISKKGDEDVGTTETSEEAKIKQQEWGSEGPVNVAGIVDLTVDVLDSIWDMLVLLDDLGVFIADTITSGHCEVGEEGNGGDECGQDMEKSFLLPINQYGVTQEDPETTYHWDPEGHGVEGNG